MKKAVVVPEYDFHTDSIYDMPGCPECQEGIYGLEASDIGTSIKCPFCNTEFTIPDEEWVHEYIRENTGSRQEETRCYSCGGRMKQVLYKRKGEWHIGCGECRDCGLKFIV